jgi:hypothetical protein
MVCVRAVGNNAVAPVQFESSTLLRSRLQAFTCRHGSLAVDPIHSASRPRPRSYVKSCDNLTRGSALFSHHGLDGLTIKLCLTGPPMKQTMSGSASARGYLGRFPCSLFRKDENQIGEPMLPRNVPSYCARRLSFCETSHDHGPGIRFAKGCYPLASPGQPCAGALFWLRDGPRVSKRI